jgi:hypothetical protein
MKRIVLLLFLTVLGLAVWRFHDPLRAAIDGWRDARTTRVATSPELAAGANLKLSELASGQRDIIALSEAELQSLLEYHHIQLLPAFVDSPRIEIRRDRLRLVGRVPVERLPRVRGIGNLAGILPDTAELAVTGQLFPFGEGRVAFGIDDVSTSRISLPRSLLGPLLVQLGRVDEPGLPADALALPLPPGVGAAYVRGDSLYLRTSASQRGD